MRHIAAAFYNTPHAITVDKLEEIRAFLQTRFASSEASAAPRVAAGPRDGVQMVGRVAVVPVFGVLAQRMNMMSDISGGTSTEQLGGTIDSLAADPAVKSIVLNVDSPGGSVFGIQELGDKIQAARNSKKVIAVANSMAASAAYWISAQASEVVVTPSGQVGSVGVIAAHTDQSKLEESAGLKTTLVTAGKYKAELDPSQPLSEDARANLQDAVDKYYSMFVKAVAKGRDVTPYRVEADFGQGRMLLAKDAVRAGMADRIGTLEDTLKRLGAGEQAAGARARAADMAALGLPTGAMP